MDFRRGYSGLSALKHIPDVHAPNAIRLRVITQTEAKIEDGGMLKEEYFTYQIVRARAAPPGLSRLWFSRVRTPPVAEGASSHRAEFPYASSRPPHSR